MPVTRDNDARDHVEVHPQKKIKGSSLFGKKKKRKKTQEQRNIVDINCKV